MGIQVECRTGWLEGSSEDGVEVFRGIPFAAPPVGRARHARPGEPAPWRGVRDATAFGPDAPQTPGLLSALLGLEAEQTDEDCLFVNVWRPVAERQVSRPVLVWIHGGGFTVGGGSWSAWDPSALVRRGGVIVVNVSYRLGVLGFLDVAHGGPDAEAGARGNFGLLDQIAALTWVRDEIAGFGGDPGNVTVFGESAGAMSIAALLGAPAAKGLFHKAILQSGAAANVHVPSGADEVARAFAREAGLAALETATLRGLPLQALLAAQDRCVEALRRPDLGLPFQPQVDGSVLPESPLEAIEAGRSHRVPLLIGSNEDEWNLWSLASGDAQLDEDGWRDRSTRALPGADRHGVTWAERADAVYRGVGATPGQRWMALLSDRWFHHPAAALAERHARRQPDTWVYRFRWKSPALGGAVGAAHALEVPFVFGGIESEIGKRFAGDDVDAVLLSERMQDAWISFARDGEPTHADLSDWPRYAEEERAVMAFDRECEVDRAPQEERRALWEELATEP